MILDLLKVMEKEVKEVFEGFKLPQPADDEDKIAKVNVYQMDLPIKKKENDESHFPFVIINPVDGEVDENETITLNFVFGFYNDNEDKQGGKELLVALEKLKNHLIHKKFFGEYDVQNKMKWMLQEEDLHPYYYGILEIKVRENKIMQEMEDFL